LNKGGDESIFLIYSKHKFANQYILWYNIDNNNKRR